MHKHFPSLKVQGELRKPNIIPVIDKTRLKKASSVPGRRERVKGREEKTGGAKRREAAEVREKRASTGGKRKKENFRKGKKKKKGKASQHLGQDPAPPGPPGSPPRKVSTGRTSYTFVGLNAKLKYRALVPH